LTNVPHCAGAGGGKRDGVQRSSSVRAPASRTGSNGGNPDAFGGDATDWGASGKAHHPAPRRPRCAAHRRMRRNALALRNGRWR